MCVVLRPTTAWQRNIIQIRMRRKDTRYRSLFIVALNVIGMKVTRYFTFTKDCTEYSVVFSSDQILARITCLYSGNNIANSRLNMSNKARLKEQCLPLQQTYGTVHTMKLNSSSQHSMSHSHAVI